MYSSEKPAQIIQDKSSVCPDCGERESMKIYPPRTEDDEFIEWFACGRITYNDLGNEFHKAEIIEYESCKSHQFAEGIKQEMLD